MTTEKNKFKVLLPIMAAFFTMGFVDMVGTATNYVKADFALSDTMSNFLPSMVFFWFFLLSVPTSLLMNRIGKRKTVLLSIIVTAVALVIPLFKYSYPVMLVSFCFLGIGNTLMQVSLNPLLGCVVSGERLASSLTFGQFVKAIASFIAPILASWLAVKFNDWKILYWAFFAIAVLTTILFAFNKVEEEPADTEKTSSFFDVLKLLGDPVILLLFVGIICHVGVDVGINTCAPKIMMERLGLTLADAALATSVYFLFRTVGCLTGSLILAKWKTRKFFCLSAVLMVLSMILFFICKSRIGIYVAIALVGYGNSNVFSMIMAKALQYKPASQNEVSGLLIMGLIGGSIFPLFMGILSDALASQIGSLIVISAGVIYLFYLASRYLTKKI
jgi:fucose permease